MDTSGLRIQVSVYIRLNRHRVLTNPQEFQDCTTQRGFEIEQQKQSINISGSFLHWQQNILQRTMAVFK